MAEHSILTTSLANLDRTGALLRDEVNPDVLEKVRTPRERIEVELSPELEDHKVHVLKAYLVRHSDALGPAKGGIRMTPTVSLDDVNGLAMEMTWKCALIGVPFGGGKSGIVADPRQLDRHDKEVIIRSFARNCYRHIGPLVYVPAPDMGTNQEDMGHIKDAISNSLGQATTHGCYVTGKPVILGGIPGRREATGQGVTICVLEALKHLGMDIRGARIVVQGFGNVGSVAALRLAEHGATIVAVGDLGGAVANDDGLDIQALHDHVTEAGTVLGFAGGTELDSSELLTYPCDVLCPAAAQDQITEDNAADIRASVIAEGANGPTTPEADDILNDRGIFIIPDILCNAGGVFVSYLEYTQETQQEQMPREEVETRLQRRMTERFHRVVAQAGERSVSTRQAAMCLAVKTVCEALEARGHLP